jgi:two-component system, NtrC family, sensor kinase
MRIQLYKRIFLNFVLVIALFGLFAAVVGAILIERTTLREAQRRANLDLRKAWSVIQGEFDSLELFLLAISNGKRVHEAIMAPESLEYRAVLEAVRRQGHLDFMTLIDTKGQVVLRTLAPYNKGDHLIQDPFVRSALKGQVVSGFAVLDRSRLKAEGGSLEEKSFIVFEPTPKAKPRAQSFESDGMALVAATPVEDETGKRLGVLYGGILLNRNRELVDKIHSVVFEDQMYKNKPLGTMTIFQWDTRIATNVTLANGNRAIGTRVSQEVYDKVLENDLQYYDRAFVVNDWYLSAYDPIHDTDGKVIGILYVGVLAKPYDDLKWDLWKLYGLMSMGAAVIVLGLGLVFSRRLTGSISRLAHASGQIALGKLDMSVPEPLVNDEVRDLTKAFNLMAESLREREERLTRTNAELESTNQSLHSVNQNYLDMLGFVSHELKNTLGVVSLSAKALTMDAMGQLSASQQDLVRNIVRSIDKAQAMSRNYLDLSHIEKGELQVKSAKMDMIDDVFTPLLEEFKRPIEENSISVESGLPEHISLTGDRDLLQIVVKNLIDNALKYGRQGGVIRLNYTPLQTIGKFEVWNQGNDLHQEELSQVFEKFVRIRRRAGMPQGTGLGLFITRDIIKKHGGEIWAECGENHWVKFIFTLPLTSPDDSEELAANQHQEPQLSGS